MIGDLRCAITEVMDLDEEIYKRGWKVRMYGETDSFQPSIYARAKEQVERTSEADTIEGLAQHVKSLLSSDDDLMIVWEVAVLTSNGRVLWTRAYAPRDRYFGAAIDGKRKLHADLNEQQLLLSLLTKMRTESSVSDFSFFLNGRTRFPYRPR